MNLLKGWLWKVAAGAIAVLSVLVWWHSRTADKARSARDKARRNAEAHKAVRARESAIREGQAQAREEAREAGERLDSRREAGNRPESFGDPRTRDEE